MTYIPIIGLEIHVELRTKSKMFCGCPADHFGKPPNAQTCPVCLGLPGALPVPNRLAVTWTHLIGTAFGCRLNQESKFDRKHYFYPDLPKGYQISQYDEPLCTGGVVKTDSGTYNLTRIHLEEDTGKLQHIELDGERVSLVDFNRSGVALVEIVSEPVLHSAAEAKAYAQTVRKVINFLGVSDADMEKGSMRLEANISLLNTTPGVEATLTPGVVLALPPYKVEVKNINSFRFLEKAINYEIDRQTKLLEQGITPTQETRGFNESRMATVSQRSKEEAKDYRYFPEPDIPPMVFSEADLRTVKKMLPLLPADYVQRFTDTYHVRADYAVSLTEHCKLAEKALACFALASPAAQKIAGLLINKKAETEKLAPTQIVALLTKTSTAVTSVDLELLIKASVAANPALVAKYKAGKTAVIGAFVGDVMRRSHGMADPKQINMVLAKLLKP